MFKFNTLKPKNPISFIFSLVFLVELLSFLAYFKPELQVFLLGLIFLGVLMASLYSLEAGLLIMLVELVIGSKGHLFSASFFGLGVSLRLVIFLALMLATLVYLLRNDFKTLYRERIRAYRFWPLLMALVAFLGLALVNGWLSANSLNYIFHDFNAWLFIPIIVPLVLVYLPQSSKEQSHRLIKIFSIAIIWLSLKSLIFLYAFSHNLIFVPDLYLWIRRSGVGEITAMSGGFTRIFIQSQVYLALAFFIILYQAIFEKHAKYFKVKYLALLTLIIGGLILSMSRSFWLAIIVTFLVTSVVFFRTSYRKYLHSLAYISVSLVLALALIFAIIKFPLPSSQSVSLSALGERLDISNTEEAATASRWALLPVLTKEIVKRPIVGSGFGATVSYYSKDPRVLEQDESGLYTSYAFEWAYLDTWLKLGLIGFLIYLSYITLVLIRLWQHTKTDKSPLVFALTAALLFFIVVNIFTPYLNHPLGLAFLLLSSCFVKKNPI